MTDEQKLNTSGPFGAGRWMIVILAVAAFLRCYKLASLPPAVFRDEAEKALNAWFLLTTGMDASGRPWPIFIEVFGVTTSAIYQYIAMVMMAVGGLNEWTLRLPAACAGVGAVWFTWLLGRQLGGPRVGLCAAGLLAVSPWHVPLSRWAQQGAFLPVLFAAAVWMLAVFVNRKKSAADDGLAARSPRDAWWLCGSAALLAGAVYTYDPAKVFAPLLVLAMGALWWPVWRVQWRVVAVACAVGLVASVPVLWLMLSEGDAAQVRFKFLSVFQPGVPFSTGLMIAVANYLEHFMPGYLLVHGDAELRHSAGVGVLNIVELVGAVAGAVFAVKRRCRWGALLIVWILLSPVAASLTRVGIPHALRTQLALPAWQLLAAMGIMQVLDKMPVTRRRAVGQLVFLVALVGAFPFVKSYFGSYATRSAFHWQYGVQQAMELLDKPGAENARVRFHNVTGAEYLVGFYGRMGRKEFRQMVAGRSRYEFVPFQPPDRPAPTVDEGAVAWVTPPGYAWSPELRAVPIYAPGETHGVSPALVVYLSPALAGQMGQSAGGNE